jgi:hypothetical protein
MKTVIEMGTAAVVMDATAESDGVFERRADK